MQKSFFFKIAKGSKFALEVAKEETDLTAEMIASGAWKTASFSKKLETWAVLWSCILTLLKSRTTSMRWAQTKAVELSTL